MSCACVQFSGGQNEAGNYYPGSGQMGRALAADLSKDGYVVILLSRNPEKVTGLPTGVRAEKWDGRTAEGWGHLAEGATVILNCAGENIGIPPILWWVPGRRQRVADSRVDAGRAVVEAVRAVRFLIENQAARGVFNLSAPDPKANADFGRLIAWTLHRPYWFPVPALMMRLWGIG